MSSAFYPRTISYVKHRAKELQAAFPGLPLSAAQQATARALGFTDWFDCQARLQGVRTNDALPDEALPRDTVLARHYHQIRALAEVGGLPASDADAFVRCWRPTATARPALGQFLSSYAEVEQVLASYEQDPHFTEFESGGEPHRIADGIIEVAWGTKNPFYYLSIARLRQMPAYLRGEMGAFLSWEHGLLVALTFPECFAARERIEGLNFLAAQEPWLYECHTGQAPPDFRGMTLRALMQAAEAAPAQWFALSSRRLTQRPEQWQEPLICALRGRDYVRFLQARGDLTGLQPAWFALHAPDADARVYALYLNEPVGTSHVCYRDSELRPIAPPYGSPFKRGPLHREELNAGHEIFAPRLDEELERESV